MSFLTALRQYASKADPSSLPTSVLFTHTANSLTIFDAFPKATFHFLVLPRARPPLTVFELASLRTLLKGDKQRARQTIQALAEDAKQVRAMIEEEMVSRYGFKWEVWMGFHAVPSMEHLHLHVISSDLCSPSLKTKKHYNSFHPKLGFFLSLDDVLSWFDADPTFYSTMSVLKPTQYEPLLKETLSCWRCGRDFKNMPTLKAHLQEEWDKEAEREKTKAANKKRKHGSENSADSNSERDEHAPKRLQTGRPAPADSEEID
ncbi:HIT-like protein [Obba rivulosa]|uniref:HIT-like protein n=1 Tax=Obba rivulosa TaxID=1052685 RepID=A0A8E2DSG1_9APHY|nr:HIT-like protein [Obba rivulosa]